MGADRALLDYLDASAGPAPPPAAAAAEAILARHGGAVLSLLFYGSALREPDCADRTIDIYVLAESYRAFHRRPLAALANRLLPPNVYRLETRFGDRTLRAKYTVLRLADFERLATPRAFQSLIWGRFSQPCAIAYARDEAVRARLVCAFAEAARTMLRETLGLMPSRFTAREIWLRALSESYASELRPERPERSREIFEADPERYERIAALILGGKEEFAHAARRRENARARRRWAVRRVQGKMLGVARIAKGAFTFEGGLDYILEKVESHSGVTVNPTTWQRRHPLLAAPVLAFRLYRRGAFR